ncbi:MAG: RluA family pseudouridine synthase [Fusicatenibacter sp.]|nr:RluA family pseudouridine synthase [Fusicatenibacter sp.]
MEESIGLTVSPEMEGLRIDKFLSEMLKDYSRSYLQKLLRDEKVMVNQKPVKASFRVSSGEEISVILPEMEELSVEPENIPLSILYEDDDLLVIDKPKGMVVHPSAGHESGTLVNAVLYHCQGNLSGINGILRPGIVHRIDMDTTGALVICKNDYAHQKLAEQLEVHSITRKYRAIVHGNLPEDDGTIQGAIGRHPTDRKKMALNEKNGKPAVTHYHVLERFGAYTYVECQLETGRTHQIRVHMASIRHPILGDQVYGPQKCPVKNLQGQTLHAMVLGFIHPVSGEYMEFTAPLPEYFEKLLCRFRGNHSDTSVLNND